MNRFSYLAAISVASAATYKSSQLLLEAGITAQPNIRTFRYTDITTEWTVATTWSTTLQGYFYVDATANKAIGTAETFTLVEAEHYLVEVDHSTFVKAIVPLVVSGSATAAFGTPEFAAVTGSDTIVPAIDTVDGSITGTNIAAATAYVRNYRFPAYRVKCTGTAGSTSWFGLEAQDSGTATNYYYRTFGCTQVAAARGTAALVHASIAELNADVPNRLVAPTTVDLLLDNASTTDPDNTSLNIEDRNDWLEHIDGAVFGKKIAGEYFTVATGEVNDPTNAASLTVNVASDCMTNGLSDDKVQHALVQLNDLKQLIASYTATAAPASPTNKNAYAFRVPDDATPGQKYFACVKVGTTTKKYTTVQVEVDRPVWWAGASSTTNLVANQGSAVTTEFGLPAASEWGFTATSLATSTAYVFAESTTKAATATQPTVDIMALSAAQWSATSTTIKIASTALSCRNGEYLSYKLTASTNKLYTHFWTGQSGMGRGLPAAVANTFQHLEVFSFAQPGAAYATTTAQPMIVLRVPEAAVAGDVYVAGFSVSDEMEQATPNFYTGSLAVTVAAARRFGSSTDFAASLKQPLFTTTNTLTAATTPVTSSPFATKGWISVAASQWKPSTTDGGAVTGAIPGQVVAFVFPTQCRVDEIYTNAVIHSGTAPTDGWLQTSASVTELALEERGSFQGDVSAASATPAGVPGRVSFMVPTAATTGTVYYAGMKIMNNSTPQYAAVSVTVKAFTAAILTDGVATLGAATVTVPNVGVAPAIGVTNTQTTTPTGTWWLTASNILTPDLKLYDGQKAVVAFNSNVGLTDRSATDTLLTAANTLGVTGRYAHIPADGFTAGTTTTYPAIEFEMDLTASFSDLEFGTATYVYRTYEMLVGGPTPQTYYGAVRAQVMEPESFTTKAAFDLAIPASAAGYASITTAVHAAWTKATTTTATPVVTTGTVWANSATTASTAASSALNKIAANVNNGDSFVVGIDADATVTWDAAAVPAGKGLIRREQLDCATFAQGSCYPSYSFRMPQTATTGDVYYAAAKVVVGTTSNLLVAGTYYIAVQATVTEPVRHYPTWAGVGGMSSRPNIVSWSWANTAMPTTAAPTAANNGWTIDATAKVAGWQEATTNVPVAVNVAPAQEVCFDFSDSTNAFTLSTLTLETAAAVSGATAYTASTGSQPTLVAQVTGDQLANLATGLNVAAWCFTAPATGFGYVIVKSGTNLYLPLKVDVASRPRTFPTVAALDTDAGDRFAGSVVRTYSDLPRQWADTVPATIDADTSIDTTYLIDEVAVKQQSDPTDKAGAVSIGAFAVVISGSYTSCTEYAEAKLMDTATAPAALSRPTTWLTSFGTVDEATGARNGNSEWAFSWQVPSTALAADVYYLGLRCINAGNDYSAMWKVSVTDRPVFAATSAALATVTGNTAFAFTGFSDKTQGVWVSGTAIPDPARARSQITQSFEVEAGKGFSVTLDVTSATAFVVDEEDLLDLYNEPLNLEARSLILYGEVATETAAVTTVGSEVNAIWSALPTSGATATVYPGFSWQVPAGADVGEVHYAAVKAVSASQNYVALFECTVKAAPVVEPEVVEEESGVMGAIITTAIVTLVIAAALAFILL